MLKRWRHNQAGTTAIEYALVASLIAAAVVTGITLMTTGTGSLYGRVGEKFNTYLGS